MKRTGDLNFAIEENFGESDIEIASPQRDINTCEAIIDREA